MYGDNSWVFNSDFKGILNIFLFKLKASIFLLCFVYSVCNRQMFGLEILKNRLKDAPKTSGVYLFKNKKDVPIYIGKAINIKRRLRPVTIKWTVGSKLIKSYVERYITTYDIAAIKEAV